MDIILCVFIPFAFISSSAPCSLSTNTNTSFITDLLFKRLIEDIKELPVVITSSINKILEF